MSFFNTSSTLYHRTALPATVTASEALSLLHNHDFVNKLDPEFVSQVEIPPPATPNPGTTPNETTKYYKITDHMEALPRGLWDTTVEFQLEITNTANGNERFVRAPLGLTQRSVWSLEPSTDEERGAGAGDWALLETTHIFCSRLLMGTIKAKCEENWKPIHGRFLEGLKSGNGVADEEHAPVEENGAVVENGTAGGK